MRPKTKNEHLNALLQLSRTAFRIFDRKALLQHVAEIGLKLLESDTCMVYLLDDDSEISDSFVFKHDTVSELKQTQWLGLENKIIGEAALIGQGGIYNNLEDSDTSAQGGCQHVLVVPLRSEERLLGALGLIRHSHMEESIYTQESLQSLQSIASMLTLKLEYQRLTDAQQRQQTAEQVLKQISLVGGMLGHKLRGFLGGISLTTQELRDRVQATDSVTAALINNLIEGSGTAARLNAQFLSMQKPLKQQTVIVNLKSLIDAALRQIDIRPEYTVEIDNGRVGQKGVVTKSVTNQEIERNAGVE